ncbi:MAG: hypothetical protein EOP24_26035 [Hyphomicrobiales bacterium]|nr:MAG: hypothetical protein EOP24_26035 [Hyphomicrobiales bacterium]
MTGGVPSSWWAPLLVASVAAVGRLRARSFLQPRGGLSNRTRHSSIRPRFARHPVTMLPASLPYISPPYPDEILGSWLSRLRTLNGAGAWTPLLVRHLGVKMLLTPLFQPPSSDDLCPLISDLGFEYQMIVRRHTLLPYYHRFESVQAREAYPAGRTEGIPALPRFCPLCIDDDQSRCGTAYWHLTHQIPNVWGCEKHLQRLQDHCHACGRTPRIPDRRLLGPLSSYCVCGADLRRHVTPLSSQSPHWRLVQFSKAALISETEPPGEHSVSAYFSEVISTTGSLYKVHKQARIALSDASLPAPRNGKIVPSARPLARDLCIHFAGQGFTLERSLQTLRNARERLLPPPAAYPAMSLSEAKAVLLQKLESDPGLRPSSWRRPYWVVRIYDDQWLDQHFPVRSTRRRPVPKIELDRAKLLAALEKFPVARAQANQPEATVRASIRDRTWFQQTISEFAQREIRPPAERRGANARRARVEALALAIERLATAEPPLRIKVSTLAHQTSDSNEGITHLLGQHPELRRRIDEVNSTKEKRMLEQAAREMIAEGTPLIYREWLRRAKLPSTPARKSEADEILAALQPPADKS